MNLPFKIQKTITEKKLHTKQFIQFLRPSKTSEQQSLNFKLSEKVLWQKRKEDRQPFLRMRFELGQLLAGKRCELRFLWRLAFGLARVEYREVQTSLSLYAHLSFFFFCMLSCFVILCLPVLCIVISTTAGRKNELRKQLACVGGKDYPRSDLFLQIGLNILLFFLYEKKFLLSLSKVIKAEG